MICQQCSSGFLSPSLPMPLVLQYRSFSKRVATQHFLECSNCPHESDEPITGIDVDAAMASFRREVNMRLSAVDL